MLELLVELVIIISNKKGENMKCIKNSDKYMKVSEDMAAQKVKEGWVYCPRSEFKKASKADKSSCQVISKAHDSVSNKPKKAKLKKMKKEVESTEAPKSN